MLIVVGAPRWGRVIEAVARDIPIELQTITQQAGYVNTLIDTHAALVLVDGSLADWAWYSATAKASPATRRIPIVVISPSDDVRQQAESSGADFTLTPRQLSTHLPGIITDHARIQSEAERQHLATQCDHPLPPKAKTAIEQFNSGQYYKQHDLFEELWMQEEGPVRDLYRAILQVGIAYYQVQRGNRRGAYKMLLRAVQWLTILPDRCQGVDVAQLRTDAAALRTALEALPDDQAVTSLEAYLKPVVYSG